MAKQITVRGVSEQLSRKLDELSRARGESLNATVLHILQQATGTEARRQRLARYTTWTAEDLRAFQHALSAQRTIDEKLWR